MFQLEFQMSFILAITLRTTSFLITFICSQSDIDLLLYRILKGGTYDDIYDKKAQSSYLSFEFFR